MFREVKILLVALFVAAFVCVPTSALSLSSLERTSEATDNIEINTPSEGYDFDANFLAKNQELSYKATIINDEGQSIKIDSINLNTSSYDFFDYSYDGISVDDILKVGESRDITILVKTNSNDTQTVSDDYNLAINYSRVQPTPDPITPDTPDTPDTPNNDIETPPTEDENPETSDIAAIKSATAITIGIAAVTFIFIRNKKIRNYAIILTFASFGTYALFHTNAFAENSYNFNIKGKINFTNIYTVTVNPNGGIYDGKTENTVVTRREGQTYHVNEAEREGFDFIEWQVNPGELDENNDIEIHADTTIKAKWDEIVYTLTIKPNGGNYLNSSEEWSEDFRPNETATISVPTKEGHDFTGWTVEEGSIGENGFFDGTSITMTENVTLVANYDIKTYTVTVIPNGGTYHGSTNTYTTTVDWDSTYEIEAISRKGYDLKDWTKNDNETLPANTQSITNIRSNVIIEANWWSSTFYTVTIIPNGGIYDNKTEASEYSVREGTEYTMLDATYDGMILDYWHYTGTDTHMNESSFIVNEDISLTAEWLPIVAKIKRTGKYYPSIMAAHEEANPEGYTDDTIILLVDTTEIVTNTKSITLDLNTHTVTGYLTNTASGNLTLINGTFDNYQQNENDSNNPHGAALINNGTLTMGYDDYIDDEEHVKEAIVNHDYVKLFGNEYGLEQNGTFNYFDGQIEGEIGLKGGYNKSPWYRTMSNNKEIHFFPFVSKNTTKNQQHVQLENSNLAVSKTIDNGEIYYYNLQDNIDTSTETGYKIYIVRDFPASYTVTIESGDTINIDLDGFSIDSGFTWTNNGTLNITDNKAPGENKLYYSQTFINNGTLSLSDVNLAASNENTVLSNAGSLTLSNATISSEYGNALELAGSNATVNADSDSVVSVDNKNFYALVNNATDATIAGGTYTSNKHTISNSSSKNLTISSGVFTIDPAAAAIIINNNGTLNLNGGEISFASDTNTNDITGIKANSRSAANINAGTISLKSRGKASAIDCSYGTNNIYSGSIIVETTNGNAYGLNCSSSTTSVSKGENATTAPTIKVTANSTNNTAYSAIGVDYVTNLSDASIEVIAYGKNKAIGIADTTNTNNVTASVTSANGNAYGVQYGTEAKNSNISVNSTDGVTYGVYARGQTINGNTITSNSTNNNAYGYYIYGNSDASGKGYVQSGVLTATTENNDKLAYGVFADKYSTVEVTGGNISGTNFGVSVNLNSRQVTIGTLDNNLEKDSPIISGGDYGIDANYINFYDGTLIGGTDYIVNHDTIQAIPTGADYHKETIANKNNCWLVVAEDWLLNTRLNKTYNSFDAAYTDDNFQDGDTLQITQDIASEAIHANNTHTVTIDINGNNVNFTQPILNSGTMTITDNHPTKKGKLINDNVAKNAIDNQGSLTVQKSEISGACTSIYSHATGNTLTISDGSHISIGDTSSSCKYAVNASSSNMVTIDSSTITAESTSSTEAAGFYASSKTDEVLIKNSNISATSTDAAARAVYIDSSSSYCAKVTIESGNYYAFSGIDPEDPSTYDDTAYAVTNGAPLTLGIENAGSNDNLTIKAIGNAAYAAGSLNRTGTIYNGNITAIGKTAAAGAQRSTIDIYGGNISGSTIGDKTGSSYVAYGVYANTLNIYDGTIASTSAKHKVFGAKADTKSTISGGSINATKGENNTNEAIGLQTVTGNITGGTIRGDNYGLNHTSTSASKAIVLGNNEDNKLLDKNAFTITGGDYGIKNGYVYFYDGTIIGKDAEGYDYIVDRGSIKAIPAGASYHITTENGQIKCWLTTTSEFLYNERLDKRYNSFDAAFTDEHIQDGDTITVLESNTSEAVISANTHDITIDLNGNIVTNSQTIPNSGTLTITDSSDNETGILQSNNATSTAPAINNTGTLKIEKGTVAGLYYAIKNSGTYQQTGGTVKVTGSNSEAALYINGTSDADSSYITNGKVIFENNTTDSTDADAILLSSGTITIRDSEITATSNKGEAKAIEKTGQYNATVNIYGSTVITASSAGSVTGISGGTIHTYKEGDKKPQIIAQSSNSSAYGISAGGTITDTIVSVTAKNTAEGVANVESATGNAVTVQSSNGSAYGLADVGSAESNTITVTASSDSAYGLTLYGGTATSNTINVTNQGIAYGIYGRNFTINSGTATVHSINNNAYGYYTNANSDYYSRNIKIKGGDVAATTDNSSKLAYGFYAKKYTAAVISGGNISGQHYGIYAVSDSEYDTITIGEDDGTIYNGVDNPTTNPLISGGVYGVYGGFIKFYDGRIRGGTTAYFDRNIKEIATNSYMHMTAETGYDEVKYVSATEWLAKIGSGSCEPATAGTTCYPSVQAAIDNSQENDVITLLKDNYIFANLTIPQEKKATIELDGHTIITGRPIENNGTLTIQNSKADSRPLISYHEDEYFITNNGSLTIKDLDIESYAFANNNSGATLKFDGANISYIDDTYSSDYLIVNNGGTLDIANNSLVSSINDTIKQLSGSLSITNSEIRNSNGGKTTSYDYIIRIDSGSLTADKAKITSSTIDGSNYYMPYAIVQPNSSSSVDISIKNQSEINNGAIEVLKGTVEIKDSQINNADFKHDKNIVIGSNATFTINKSTLSLSPYSQTILNNGTLNVTNGSKIKVESGTSAIAVIDTKKSLTVDGSEITLNIPSSTGTSDKYGIKNSEATSSIHISNGSKISVTTASTGNTYGIYSTNSSKEANEGIYLGDTSSIEVSAPKAYGVYIDDGKFVMGEKETQHIGEDIAIQTNPLVKAISNTNDSNSVGKGLVNTHGQFFYYDGKIIGSTNAFTATVTDAEYWYEAWTDTDSETGYQYSFLKYLPNSSQQGG